MLGNFLKIFLFLALLIAPGGAWAEKGEAQTRYFMIIFAQEGGDRDPRLSHSFATFVKATGNGADKNRYQIESKTISWLPASLDIRLLRLFPEQGKNLSLKETLRYAKSENTQVSMWGPYQIRKELYERAVKQVKRLNRGATGYKAIDRRFRPEAASNCFHAISDIDMDNGMLDTGAAHGNEASYMVLEHLKRWIIRPQEKVAWIAQRLGLSDRAIVQRDFQPAELTE
jgi:hypothetical protein